MRSEGASSGSRFLFSFGFRTGESCDNLLIKRRAEAKARRGAFFFERRVLRFRVESESTERGDARSDGASTTAF